jgi:hypothetical protein
MTAQITPGDLAGELGVRPKQVRDYLRSKYGTLPAFVSRWNLTRAQTDDVRAHFRATSER